MKLSNLNDAKNLRMFSIESRVLPVSQIFPLDIRRKPLPPPIGVTTSLEKTWSLLCPCRQIRFGSFEQCFAVCRRILAIRLLGYPLTPVTRAWHRVQVFINKFANLRYLFVYFAIRSPLSNCLACEEESQQRLCLVL